MKRIKLLTLSLTIPCLLLGCYRGIRVKTEVPIESSVASKAIEDLEKSRDFTSVKIEAGAKIETTAQRYFFRQFAVVTRRGGLLRSVKFGSPLLSVSWDGLKIKAYDHNRGEFYRGEYHPGTFDDFLGLDISPGDIGSLLSGRIPLGENFAIERASLINDRYFRIGIVNKGQNSRSLLIDPTRRIFVGGEINGLDKKRTLYVAFDKFKKVGGILYPHKITLVRKEPFTELTLKIKKVTLNPVVRQEDVDIRIPAKARVFPLTDMPQPFSFED